MIKFKKMSTFAKVASVGGVTAVVGVAFIPVINKFIDNPKSKVHVYEFNNRLFKTKEAAEKARMKFTAMSGLISAMNADKTITPNLDYKPLMAEFVSFVSKMFVIKVFKMDDDSATVDHFKYDGMSEEEKQDIFQKQIEGQIHYGDLKDITSLVKYANAHKEGNEWMFTPVDEMMLSVLGDGSGQTYSQTELDYAEISKTITALKNKYEEYYSANIKDDFNGISYSLVHGLTHHEDAFLEAADHERQPGVNEGDGTGDEYSTELIAEYQKWGTLKKEFEKAKTDLDGYVSAETITPALKPIFLKMVAENAVTGWNNKERYSTDEITLRDLLAKLSTENKELSAKIIPGGHQDTNVNIVEGWNWSPSGDRTDRSYADWQLNLAKDIQDREKLINMHLVAAPVGGLIGKNYAPTGDGTGNTYDQSVFDVLNDFKGTGTRIADLKDKIDMLMNSGVIAAPADGEVSKSGLHVFAKGLHDDVDYSQSWATYQDWLKLGTDLAAAQKAKDDFDDKIRQTLFDTTPGTPGGSISEDKLISSVIDFSVAVEGENYAVNYNDEEIDYAQALDLKKGLDAQIAALRNNGVTAAPDGAVPDFNNPKVGLGNNEHYAKEQIQLRDLIAQQQTISGSIKTAFDSQMKQAKAGGMLSPRKDGAHEDQVGLGDNVEYTAAFVQAGNDYASYKSMIKSVQENIANILAKYSHSGPASSEMPEDKNGVSFQDLLDKHAVEGINNPEGYTQTEIDYSNALTQLEDLQTQLQTANAALGKFKIDNDKVTQLRKDYANGVTPLSNNQAPSGDASGIVYTSIDEMFTKNLQLIKTTFPDGNPWWTGSGSKTSDAAYFALYNDWEAAVNAGTEAINTKEKGDGTDHKFSGGSETFGLYKKYLEDSVLGLNDPAKKDRLNNDLDTILDYFEKYGSLNGMTRDHHESDDADYIGYSEKASLDLPNKGSGDKTGNAYLKIDDIWKEYYDTYVTHTHNNVDVSWKGKFDAAKTAWQTIKDNLARKATLDTKLKTAIENLDKYNKEVDRLNGLVTPLETAYNNANTAYNTAKGNADKIHSNSHLNEDILSMLSKLSLSDNEAKHFTAEQTQDVADLKALDQKIKDAKNAKSDAEKVWADVQSKEHDDYIWYTQHDVDHITTGWNHAKTGDGSGHNYDLNHIRGRDITDEIKAEIIKNHITGDADIEKELNRLKTLDNDSEVGLNSDGSTVKSSGDTSGKTWKSWEIALYTKIKTLKDLVTKIGSDNFAPEGAVFGENFAKSGDGSDTNYDSPEDVDRIKNFIPRFKKIENDYNTAKTNLETLQTQRSTLSARVSSAGKDNDPTKTFIYKGKTYTIVQFNAAKDWAKIHATLADLKDTEDQASTNYNNAKDDVKKYKDDHKTEFEQWSKDKSDLPSLIAAATPGKLADALKIKENAEKDFNSHDATIKLWWTNHKGEKIDPSGKVFGDYKVVDSYEKFIDKSKTGSLSKIYYKMDGKHVNLDGSVNEKETNPHTGEQIKLRDALKDFVNIPSSITVTDSELPTQLFNSLLDLFKNNVHEKLTIKTSRAYVHSIGKHVHKYAYFDTDDMATKRTEASETIAQFRDWLKNSFSEKTEYENSPAKGDGTDTQYDTKFFSADGKPISTSTELFHSTLGAAAFSIANSNKVAKIVPKGAEIGPNSKGTGDKSGNDYSKDDLDYFNEYKIAKDKEKEITKKQNEVNAFKSSDGSVLIRTPKGFTGKAVAKHTQPRGDKSGNDYPQEVIDDVKQFFAYRRQEKVDQGLIDDLKTKWEAVPTSKSHPSWDAVMNMDPSTEVGLNHETWWSQAEIDYNGNTVKSSQLASDIAKLQAMKITNPDPGAASGVKIPVKRAPDGAVEGFNSAPRGKHNGETYSPEEIEKRDELLVFGNALTEANDVIKTYITKGTMAAPDPDVKGVPIGKEWHPVARGDASGRTYDKQIFADKEKLDALAQSLEDAKKAQEDFKTSVGQASLDQILAQVQQGMVDGVNYKERYSTEEIALRDQRIKVGDENSHLSSVQSNGEFAISQTLTAESIVGENVKARGLENDQVYTQQQLDLRDLILKINDEERIHNIKTEQEMATVDVFSPDDSTGKAKSTTLTISVYDFYRTIDLTLAKEGANHGERGDQSNVFYTAGDINNFNNIVDLETAIKDDEAKRKVLEDKGVKPAPGGEVPVDATDTTDKTKWGQHLKVLGDGSGKTYSDDEIRKAFTYKNLLDIYNKAKTDFDDFVKLHPDDVKFFEYKTTNGIHWNPVAGRNWSDDQFTLKELIDKRDLLGVGRTSVNIGTGAPSEFGTNRGHLGGDTEGAENIVMYEGSKANIKNEVLGSDRARIGYVLNPSGSSKPSDDAPVLDSLDAVASYIQAHSDLAPKGLIEKFSLLQHMSTDDTKDIYKISETTVSKDRFNAMAENYEWGDK